MAFLIFLQSVPGIDRAQTTPSPIPTTYAHATHGLKPNNQNANPHLCSVRSRCALRGLRTGSNPLKSQSKRLLRNQVRTKPQRGKGKAEMLALSTSAASGGWHIRLLIRVIGEWQPTLPSHRPANAKKGSGTLRRKI